LESPAGEAITLSDDGITIIISACNARIGAPYYYASNDGYYVFRITLNR
jgi:hypothetical protein